MASINSKAFLIIGRQILLNNNSSYGSINNVNKSLLQLARFYSKKQLTPSIAFLTNNESCSFMKNNQPHNHNHNKSSQATKIPSPPVNTLSDFHNEEGRPLSILLTWLMSKPNAIKKYSQFYLDQGFDVLTVRISPWEILWPTSFMPIIQNELLPILSSSNHNKKLIHGFSVGGFVFSQLLKHFQLSPSVYEPLMKSIQGQIWDSVVDINGVAVGISKSVFLNSTLGQKLLQNYIELHMKLFYNVATMYYEEAHEHFYYKPLHAPSLFLASKIDPISTLDVISEVKSVWSSAGIACESQVWDNTGHVGHMQKYPEQYKSIVKDFLNKFDWNDGGAGRKVMGGSKKVQETRKIPMPVQQQPTVERREQPIINIPPRPIAPTPVFA